MKQKHDVSHDFETFENIWLCILSSSCFVCLQTSVDCLLDVCVTAWESRIDFFRFEAIVNKAWHNPSQSVDDLKPFKQNYQGTHTGVSVAVAAVLNKRYSQAAYFFILQVNENTNLFHVHSA